MVSPIQALVAAHKAARLSFLNDAIETGSSRMSGAVEIRRNEASPGQTSHERSPVGGRAECRRELNGVGLARHAEPDEVYAAHLGLDARDVWFAQSHG